ncbi:MAG: indolepyruvate ferredoxin oxidoreductase family protein, partial [Pararhodobacter sp.]|nr:indolepyruvate ferredoxin oxidoreductase family protein [Pararhodobacter sp.]
CGYPGSPLGGIDFEIVRQNRIFKGHDIEHIQGLNEELAATAVFGTQLLHEVPDPKFDGVFGMWFGKAPGVDRAADAFHHANFHGIAKNGGVLLVAGDDPHARSTMLPSDSNVLLSSFYMPVLYPGNIQEILDFGMHGIELSRSCGLWTSLKMVADVAESIGTAQVGGDRYNPVIPQMEYDGRPFEPKFHGNVFAQGMIEVEREIYYARLEKAKLYARLNGINAQVTHPARARIGIMAAGKNYFDLREALEAMGLDTPRLEELGIRIFKIGLIYPFDKVAAREFAQGLEEIIVVEDKRPFLEAFLKEALYGMADAPVVIGKNDEKGNLFLTACGEVSAEILMSALTLRLGRHFPELRVNTPAVETSPDTTPLPISRMPYFCSGCPHNRSLKVPEGAVVGAGIGCHIMTLWMAPAFGPSIDYTQMGGEGAQWVGLSRFSGTRHYYQNLGDGTYAHSGSLAIRFAIASGANITYKLLVNSVVAMTGGQDVMGGKSVKALVAELAAEGVKRIIVTTDEPERYRKITLDSIATVRHRDDILAAENTLAAIKGVTVLINDQQCAAEKRRLRKRDKLAFKPAVPVINERVCEGCGDCGAKSNCLSVEPVETEFGRKTRINQTSCNQDFSCMLGDCPSFLTVQAAPATAASAPKPKRALPQPDSRIPEPVLVVPTDRFSVFMTGIGGTGVVTVSQILATAATIAGRDVRGMDQTGSSQKAGPVASHLHVETTKREGATRVLAGTTDLFLAFDMLGASEAHNLRMASPDRTVLIASTTQSPTGETISNKAKKYPEATLLRRRLEKITRADASRYFDARDVANGLFGSETGANLLLVGAAYQSGALPIPAEAIEQAIRLNGVAVDMNIAAFRWGRMSVHAPEKLAAAMPKPVAAAKPTPLSPEAEAIVAQALEGSTSEPLAALVRRRVPELIAFQNAAYARDYAAFVGRVIAAEAPTGKSDLAEAVARNLYKLMAYKDEYEVARLMTAPEMRAELEAEFGPGVKVSWNLHPTFLRSLGVKNKVALGPWFAPAMRLLAKMKPLRGGFLDILGRTQVRRIERELIVQYRRLIEAALPRLGAETHAAITTLAALPDMVRGYEEIKLASVETFRIEAARLAADLGIAHDFGALELLLHPAGGQGAVTTVEA